MNALPAARPLFHTLHCTSFTPCPHFIPPPPPLAARTLFHTPPHSLPPLPLSPHTPYPRPPQNRAGAYCELRLGCHPDRSFSLESTKYQSQRVTVNQSGGMADGRNQATSTALSKRFNIYCKGVFRAGGVIIFYTSLSQVSGSSRHFSQ